MRDDVLGILLALLALGVGLASVRALRVETWLAPGVGLAVLALGTTWSSACAVTPQAIGAAMMIVAVVGLAVVAPTTRRTISAPSAIVLGASALAELLLALAFANVDVPVSAHDGAFHVETVDTLRRGQLLQLWYPLGFHTTVADLLALLPWVDTARGTSEAAQGLILLAPPAVYSLGRAFSMRPLSAALAALVLALTYIFPYDNQLWGGWPLTMSSVLLIGLWAAAARWIQRPSARLAGLAAVLAGAVVVTHGTELYSALVGLLVISALRWRHIAWRRLVLHGPLAVTIAVLTIMPYAAALLGWVGGGGASAVGAQSLDEARSAVNASGESWLDYVMSTVGAATPIDFPIRAVLLVVGASVPRMRLVLGPWLVFAAIVLAAGLLDMPPVSWLYVATYPWLVEHRPPQMAVVFGSLLIACGLVRGWSWLRKLRPRLIGRPHVWRRLAIASVIAVAFFGEGSAVSVYKTMAQVVGDWNSYTPDDRAAMAWLRQHAQADEVLANNRSLDAGIWAPYKAGVNVLLPRSAGGSTLDARERIVENILDLQAAPAAETEACALHVDYVYEGARQLPWDAPVLPDRALLERAPDLEEVFRSGQAAVFRLRLPC